MSAINKKVEEVNILKSKIEESKATVVVEYAGLTVSDIKTLRDELREENVEFKVIKNNISARAFEAADFSGMNDYFTGPTAVAFSKDDVTAAARILNNFSKKNKALILKGGTLESDIATLEQVQELAVLPNKEGMLSMLLSVMEAPIRGLAQVTNQISEQKDN